MSWWQTKLTSYALRYFITNSGFLDERSIDPGIYGKIGLNSEIELRNVGLNVEALKKFADLPPGLRVETARVLLLRARIPTDLWQSSIDVEIDGVEVTARLEEGPESSPKDKGNSRARSPASARSPQHRKVHRRIHSPPPHGRDGDELHIPTTQEMAMSFLQHEPVEERREIEAALATEDKGMEESIMTESSQSSVGVGTGTSLPGFLSGFIQGIQDRLTATIKNVEIRLETEVGGEGEGGAAVPVVLRLRVPGAGLESATSAKLGNAPVGKRNIKLSDISLDLLSDATVSSEFSDASTRSSSKAAKRASQSSGHSRKSLDSPVLRASASSTASAGHRLLQDDFPSVPPHASMRASVAEDTADPPPDLLQSTIFQSTYPANTALDIQPGDDNISWGSRRSQAATPAPEDLWNSMTSEDDLPDSLLLARAPLSHVSRSTSPTAARTRRAMSPYDRILQSPGSWPRPMTPDKHRKHSSPGSWPAIDQSQHSPFQPLTPGPATELQENPMDNKRHALETSAISSECPSPEMPHSVGAGPLGPTNEQIEDLSQSKMYSHEEAESMYMSAMTHSPKMAIPGGWGHDADERGRTESPELQFHTADGAGESRLNLQGAAEEHRPTSGNVTPRAQSPELQRTPQSALVAKRLLSIDEIVLGLPNGQSNQDAEVLLAPPMKQHASSRFRPGQGLPGAFSTYSEPASSRRQESSSTYEEERSVLWSPRLATDHADPDQSLDISLNNVDVAADLACLRLLCKMSVVGMSAFKADQSVNPKRISSKEPARSSTSTPIYASIGKFHAAIFDRLQHTHEPSGKVELLALHSRDVSLSTGLGDVDFRLGRFKTLISGTELLAFDRDGGLKTSLVLTEHTPDIAASVSTSRTTATGRSITDITIETLPLKLELDMRAIDDTLSSFGGIGGILELSASIASEGSPLSSPVPTARTVKGVRFQGDPVATSKGSEVKLNGNLGGTNITLRGDACAVSLRTTKIKTIYRETGSSATVAHVVLSGPYVDGLDLEPLSIDVANVKFDFLNAPTERDVERLISLVSPSKDKYDGDDVLIDTLNRQRHKGSLARIGLGDVKAKVAQWECLEPLAAMGSELSKLSAVAKYLPDDDRPGILTLARFKAFEAQMPVNERFGRLQITGQDFHCAHVGAPPLLALSLGTVQVDRVGHTVLLHPLSTTTGNGDALPMLMLRNLGEAEPVVKIKVFNTLVEYSVPTIVALTNMDLQKPTEEIVTDLAQSVANLARPEAEKGSQPIPGEGASPAEKKTKLDVLIHDSGIGLQPDKISAKGILVLTDARFSTILPPEDKVTARLELRRSAIFATDDATSDLMGGTPSRRAPSNVTTDSRLTAVLSQQGFVSLGSIRSMKLAVHAEGAEGGDKTVEVDVSSELLLLETCADSTQTLFAIMGGLAPPTPPSTEPKYRMQPMTIEDMMASFTGEPEKEPRSEAMPETLFDAEEDQSSNPSKSLQTSLMPDDDDDLLLASGMSASLYGPVSGMLGGVDEPVDDDGTSGNFDDTAESLLEEDPFEMTMAPADMAMGDAALVRELNKQSKTAAKPDPVDLGSYEIEDLGVDALGTSHRALGSHHRFAPPTIKVRKSMNADQQKKLPFCLRLRDANILWHLHDGYDWRKTRDGITHGFEVMEQRHEERMARRRVSAEAREDKEDIIGDVLFNSIYIQIPSNTDPQDLRRQMNRAIDDTASETESQPVSNSSRPTQFSASGRPIRHPPKRRLKIERSRTHKVSIELHNLCADVLVFPPGDGDVNSSVDVRVKDFEIYDNLSTSTWKKFLTSLNQGVNDREMAKPMVHLEIANVKTLQDYSASELTIHASLLPLRLHVDQDCLDFIVRFFSFKDETDASAVPKSPDEQPFLQRLEVDTVDIRLDYKPKRVDYALLRSGKTGELINFAALDYAPIRLKHTIVYGLRGFEPIHQTLNDIWMPDVTRRQLPKIVAGVAAVRHLSNLGAGFKDVVAIPVREYKKDGRLVRSVKKGAFQFGKTTASELARLGAKIAIGTGNVLQGTEGFLAPPAEASRAEGGWQDIEGDEPEHEPRAISSYANQPLGVFSGLRAARRDLERDLLTARDAFIAVQGEVLESTSPGAAAAAVGRYAPVVLLRPVIGATRAVGDTLLGVGNAIDREGGRRVEDVSFLSPLFSSLLCLSVGGWVLTLSVFLCRSTRRLDLSGCVWGCVGGRALSA
ncbi:Autophagy-related protein 2 CAD motif [Teratosphaeria destructans]|uniref:Autophagy-related protein 2 n=1 Tax=Teratosphaeria destructans TaxID=418781 RepID=A0A9W7SPK8_9PEZI|nr:Autophagy-related protein 2 CAD motif [Teratosphaeria destructans]